MPESKPLTRAQNAVRHASYREHMRKGSAHILGRCSEDVRDDVLAVLEYVEELEANVKSSDLHCCLEGCLKSATLWVGVDERDATHSCAEHVGDLLGENDHVHPL